MDKYLSKSKPSASAARQNPRSSKQAPETSSSPLSVVTNAPNPGQLYITCSTGHQVDGGPTRDKNYWDTRNGKLKSQGRAVREEYKKTVGSSGPLDKGILRDVVVYVNGYTGPRIRDVELKRLVHQHGGTVTPNLSMKRCTHVIASMGLSASKTEKVVQARKLNVKYVTADWILDSIDAGVRLPEARYPVVKHEKIESIYTKFRGATRLTTVPAGSAESVSARKITSQGVGQHDKENFVGLANSR